MDPPMDVDRLAVGKVDFGSLTCRPGCLWLDSMYNCNTIFHIYTYMIYACIYTYVYMYIYMHIYMSIYVYMEA